MIIETIVAVIIYTGGGLGALFAISCALVLMFAFVVAGVISLVWLKEKFMAYFWAIKHHKETKS